MSDLWIYRRRPSSLARYRHGGAAAFDPAMRSPLAGVVAVNAGPARDEEKILHFPAPTPASAGGSMRTKRSEKQRHARPKPVAPKKKDS